MHADVKVIDLFAGAGGLSLGFSGSIGYLPIAAVELDPSAAATYIANHPNVAMHVGDISDWLESTPPKADVVIGGPPCQGFSALGTRQVRDPRNALWRRYVEALALVQPLAFVMENVADFLKSGQFEGLKRECGPRGMLSEYRIEAFTLNSADFGAAQVRKRAIVIGTRKELRPVGIPLASHSKEEWRTVRSAIGDLPPQVAAVDLPASEGRTFPGPFTTTQLHLGRRPTQLSTSRYTSIPQGGNRKDIPDELLSPCWRKHRSGAGDVMGRLHWDRPSVTIRTEFWKPEKGRYLHPEEHRPITHLEAARLQGFPDDYLWVGTKSAIGRQIGNAVPIPLARAVAGHLRTAIS